MYKVIISRRKHPSESFGANGKVDVKIVEVKQFPAGRGKVLHHNTLRGLAPWLEGYYDVQLKAYDASELVLETDLPTLKPSHTIIARVDALLA